MSLSRHILVDEAMVLLHDHKQVVRIQEETPNLVTIHLASSRYDEGGSFTMNARELQEFMDILGMTQAVQTMEAARSTENGLCSRSKAEGAEFA